MKRYIQTTICILFLILALFSCTDRQTFARQDKLGDFFQKKKVTIAVTDSGLGGLSILAEAVEKMREAKIFNRIDFIFFNALFSNQGGYNSLKTQKEKILIFDSALRSLTNNYDPDLILIGCNTLSVLYDSTSFSKEKRMPVVGIVDSGVDLIAQILKEHPEAKVIIFATQTTIEEGTHKKRLVDKGFLAERIITQACPDLVPYIEKGRSSDETEMLIYAYTDEALQKLSDPLSSLYVSFNCTHYGYSLDLWEKVFQGLQATPQAFLNPNSRMINFLFPPEFQDRFGKTEINTHMVSMVEIEEDKISSIGSWLAEISPQTAEAFRTYEWKKDLFEWKKYVTTER
jgi:glutamate racemase